MRPFCVHPSPLFLVIYICLKFSGILCVFVFVLVGTLSVRIDRQARNTRQLVSRREQPSTNILRNRWVNIPACPCHEQINLRQTLCSIFQGNRVSVTSVEAIGHPSLVSLLCFPASVPCIFQIKCMHFSSASGRTQT